MTARDKMQEISAFLESKGIEYASKEAEILITETLDTDRASIYTDDFEISSETAMHINSLAERRAAGEPLQYIIGYVYFYGLKIKAGPGVLIPRPETELLVEEVLKIARDQESGVRSQGPEPRTPNSEQTQPLVTEPALRLPKGHSSLKILDLCTGSGCIALALATNIHSSDVYAVDISEKALGYARENAKINDIINITFLRGSLFEPVINMRFDLIVSNPPYIKRAEIGTLQREIRAWEPIESLDGGIDGLDFYRRIISESDIYLQERGSVILEAGAGQAGDIISIASKAGLVCKNIIKDYSGFERIVHLTKK